MGEMLLTILGVVILGGIAVGVIAYKPVRNRLIREKGYDADTEGTFYGVLALISIFAGFCGIEALGNIAPIAGAGVAAVLILIMMVKRIKAVGLGNALLVTLLQTLSIVWLFFAWVFKTAWGLMNGMSSTPKVNKDAERKAALMREYEDKVAGIRRGSDEISDLTGETDAAVAAARKDYESAVSQIDHEYKS